MFFWKDANIDLPPHEGAPRQGPLLDLLPEESPKLEASFSRYARIQARTETETERANAETPRSRLGVELLVHNNSTAGVAFE